MIHHHSHRCPLVRCESGQFICDFICDGCRRHGSGPRYRCHNCNFDLHLSCAKYTFPCHGHPLTYEPGVRPGVQIICDACNTRVYGTHYCCRGCDFQVHPTCVQRRTIVPAPPRPTIVPPMPRPRPCQFHTVYCVYCIRCNPRRC